MKFIYWVYDFIEIPQRDCTPFLGVGNRILSFENLSKQTRFRGLCRRRFGLIGWVIYRNLKLWQFTTEKDKEDGPYWIERQRWSDCGYPGSNLRYEVYENRVRWGFYWGGNDFRTGWKSKPDTKYDELKKPRVPTKEGRFTIDGILTPNTK